MGGCWGEDIDLIEVFYSNRGRVGEKIKGRFYCNQQIFRSVQPNGEVDLMWVLHRVGTENFLNKPDPNWIKHSL